MPLLLCSRPMFPQKRHPLMFKSNTPASSHRIQDLTELITPCTNADPWHSPKPICQHTLQFHAENNRGRQCLFWQCQASGVSSNQFSFIHNELEPDDLKTEGLGTLAVGSCASLECIYTLLCMRVDAQVTVCVHARACVCMCM